MRNDSLAYALGNVDPQYILEAEEALPVRRSRIRVALIAACLILAVLLAATVAIASGVLDPLLAYYMRGDTENYLEEILSAAGSVSNEKMELRIEGAITDGDACYMVVSFIGKTAWQRFKLGDRAVGREVEIYGLRENGERIIGAGTTWGGYMSGTAYGRVKSFILDASQTMIVIYKPRECGILDVHKLCFGYGGLVLELEPAKHMSPWYTLTPEKSGDDTLKDVHISRIGFSFVQPLSEGMSVKELRYKLYLIRTDGTVLTSEEMGEFGYGYSNLFLPDADETKFVGNWGRVPAFALIDLDEYCGLQINGTNYYYAAA